MDLDCVIVNGQLNMIPVACLERQRLGTALGSFVRNAVVGSDSQNFLIPARASNPMFPNSVRFQEKRQAPDGGMSRRRIRTIEELVVEGFAIPQRSMVVSPAIGLLLAAQRATNQDTVLGLPRELRRFISLGVRDAIVLTSWFHSH